MSIIIGADFVPTPSNYELFENGDIQELLGNDLLKIISEADYRIFNMEIPLTNSMQPIPKSGPNLYAPQRCFNVYTALHVDLVTLANNHIMDQGVNGCIDTCRLLDEAGIAHVGVGYGIMEARKPHVFLYKGKRIGVYACAEHEFSICTPTSIGANPLDLLDTPDHVAELSEQCDYTIVLMHGGKEHYPYPLPEQQKVCRKLIDKGANLVVCQHSHCVGCKELYHGGTIVYGQGNFLFDGKEDECWQTGLLIALEDDGSLRYIPLNRERNTVRLAKGEKATKILADFQRQSERITERGFVEQELSSFAAIEVVNELLFMRGLRQKGLVYRAISKTLGEKGLLALMRCLCSRRYMLNILNNVRCETHREIFMQGVRDKLDI